MSIDFNQNTFIAEFESFLDGLGFVLKKQFDDSDKGGRFFERGGNKNKAMGRYKYVPPHMSSSGKALIIYTFFEMRDKATQKIISVSKTEYFWDKSDTSKRNSSFDKKEYERKKALRLKNEALLQEGWSKLALSEYKSIYDENANADDHPYIKRKNVKAGRGLVIAKEDRKIPSYYNIHKTDKNLHEFYYIKKGDLMIPAIDINLNFRTYQKINAEGTKRQRIDITTIGAFYCLGEWRENTTRIYLVEGYATGYTLHRAMNSAVVFVCFDVNNIGVVASLLAEQFPFIEFILCTDNDRKKSTKVGLYKGLEYAYRFNKPFIFPKFFDGPEYDELSDWNDLATVLLDSEINEMVLEQIADFHAKGKAKCINEVANYNGLSNEDLREYAQNSKIENLFATLDL